MVWLPATWQDHSVSIQEVELTRYEPGEVTQVLVGRAPMITLRHPNWRASAPYQDIPVVVFTRVQWDSLHRGKFWPAAFAGGVMDELWHNQEFVFAMNTRWNAADGVKEWREVWHIVQQNRAANRMAQLHPI